jgi:hypothetical protein
MSRSGYSDDCDDNWQIIMWRGRVASATKGKRGQKLLQDLIVALDEMPQRRLISNELKCADGVCALGALGEKRGIEFQKIHPEDYDAIATTFDIASPLAQEIMYLNDETFSHCTPEVRWERMRDWCQRQLKPAHSSDTEKEKV